MLKKNKYLEFMEKSRAIGKYFPDDLEIPIDLWTREKVEEYHTEAVFELLEHAFQNNGFYRTKFQQAGVAPGDFKTLEDIARFPFTFKHEVRGNPWLLLAVPREEIAQIHMSTGTTSKSIGDHIYRLYSWDDIYVNECAVRFPLMSPNRPGDIIAIALPYEMSSAGLSFHRAFQNIAKTIAVNVGKGGFYSDPYKTVIVMKDLGADILITTPSYAMYLSEVAGQNGVDVKKDFRLKLLWLTGEGSSDAFRKRLEEIYGCKAFRYYGSLECGPLGVECIMQDGYHIPEGHVYLEVVAEDTGEVLPPGMVGELCATVIYRKGAPLIRYRLEDMGYIETAECPCCIERPKVVLRGRKQDQIEIAGKTYSPYYVEEFLYQIPEVGPNYQFVIDRDGMSVVCEVRKGTEKSDKLAAMIKSKMEFAVGEIKKVELVDFIPRSGGKATRVRYTYDKEVKDDD